MKKNREIFYDEDAFPLTQNLIERTRLAIKNHQSLENVTVDLEKLLNSNELAQLINYFVTCLIDKPKDDQSFMDSGHIVLCQDFNGPIIAIGRTGINPTAPIMSSTTEVLIGAISMKGFAYRIHPLPSNWDPNLFDANIQMGEAETKICPHGNALLLSTKMLYDYASEGDSVIKIISPNHSALQWKFDRTTRKPLSVHVSALDASIILYVMRFLAQYGNDQSIEAVQHMLKHPYHYIRWDAVKALGKMDGNLLESILKELKEDPHPHVRNAVLKTATQWGF